MNARRIEEDGSVSNEVRFERLYDRHHARVAAYCRRRVRADQVDDLVAETFMVAWRRIDDVPDGEGGLPWLYRVAYRAVGHHWRSGTRRRRLDNKLVAVPDLSTSTPEDTVVDAEQTRRVLAEILRLLSWEHLSRTEIAEVLNIAPNAVNQRVHRARTNLTKEFNRLERHHPDRTPAAKKGGVS